MEIQILSGQIIYINKEGKQVIESYIDYSRKNVLNVFRNLDDFLSSWRTAERKEIIINELEQQGILFNELVKEVNMEDCDPFDLICHLVFDKKPLTRKERANNVKKRNYFTKYEDKAKEVLNALLDSYASTGIANLEDIQVLKVSPMTDFGSPRDIINNIFHGKDNFTQALKELREALYDDNQAV